MNKGLNALFGVVFVSLICITPFLSFAESLALIFGGISSNSEALTPPFVKGLKDVGYLLFLPIFFFHLFSRFRFQRHLLVYSIVVVVTLGLALVSSQNILLFAIGFRWLYPLLFPVLFYHFCTAELLRRSSFFLNRLLFAQIIFQLIQLFFASSYFGANALGISARNPGFFFIPSTAGLFAICVYLFNIFSETRIKPVTIIALLMSIFLTASATSFILFGAVFAFSLLKRRMFSLFPFLLPLPILIATCVISLSSRGLSVFADSFMPRVQLFIDALFASSLLPSSFGLGTSTSYLVANAYDLDLQSVPTDSFYSSVFVNIGFIAGFFFVALFFSLLCVSYLSRNYFLFLSMLVVISSSATVNLPEVFPSNILLSYLVAYSIRNFRGPSASLAD